MLLCPCIVVRVGQVLTKALEVWGLSAVNVDSEELKKAEVPFEAQREEAFICNLQVTAAGACSSI